MPKSEHIVVKASSIQKERIRQFAENHEMDLSEFVRYACEFFISRGSLYYPDSEMDIQNAVNINPVMDLLRDIQRDLKNEIKQVKRSIKISDLEREEQMETKERSIAIRRLRRLLEQEKFKEKYLVNWITIEKLEKAIKDENEAIGKYFDWEVENIPIEEYPDENPITTWVRNDPIDPYYNLGIKKFQELTKEKGSFAWLLSLASQMEDFHRNFEFAQGIIKALREIFR